MRFSNTLDRITSGLGGWYGYVKFRRAGGGTHSDVSAVSDTGVAERLPQMGDAQFVTERYPRKGFGALRAMFFSVFKASHYIALWCGAGYIVFDLARDVGHLFH